MLLRYAFLALSVVRLNGQVTKHQDTLVNFTEILTGTHVKTVECLISTRAARAKLQSSLDPGTGALGVLQKHKVRRRLMQVDAVVGELKKVCRIMRQVRSGALTTLEEADAVADVRDFVKGSKANGLRCLEDVRENVKSMFCDVRARGIEALASVVLPSEEGVERDGHSFDWREYYARVRGVVRCEVLSRDGKEEVRRKSCYESSEPSGRFETTSGFTSKTLRVDVSRHHVAYP